MTDEGANNLLIAITERAYKDYVIGLKVLQKKKHPYSYNYKSDHFRTAKMFLEGTKMGEYLIRKAEEEIYD